MTHVYRWSTRDHVFLNRTVNEESSLVTRAVSSKVGHDCKSDVISCISKKTECMKLKKSQRCSRQILQRAYPKSNQLVTPTPLRFSRSQQSHNYFSTSSKPSHTTVHLLVRTRCDVLHQHEERVHQNSAAFFVHDPLAGLIPSPVRPNGTVRVVFTRTRRRLFAVLTRLDLGHRLHALGSLVEGFCLDVSTLFFVCITAPSAQRPGQRAWSRLPQYLHIQVTYFGIWHFENE